MAGRTRPADGPSWRSATPGCTAPTSPRRGPRSAPAAPGTSGTPALAPLPGELPWLGESFILDVSNLLASQPATLLLGASRTAWGTLPLPFDLTSIGMPGCTLHVGGELTLPVPHTTGVGRVVLAIPALPTLLGAAFYDQVVALDPAANRLGATVSNAGEAHVGGK